MGSEHHAAGAGTTKASESKRDHVRGSSLLLTGRVFSMLINMGFQVLLVRYLSRSDFGVIAYGLTVASFVQIAVSLGQERSVSRFLVFYDEEDRPDLVAGTLALYVLSVSVLGVLAFGTTLAIGGALVGGLDNPSAAAVVAILVFVAPVDSLDMMMQNTFAAFSRTRQIFLKKYIVNPLVKF
ncbi:oligosaccharide flippase family protein, partial [Ilumatobacter sp.]|uniref:oligosaccharide flippase family protein n=1 Tax=Ilumatobacter sp. TaxID=1967498 RepID=UPI003AF87B84